LGLILKRLCLIENKKMEDVMTYSKPRDEKDVMKLVKEMNVKFVRLWFTDILGQLKSFAVPVEELEVAFSEGMGFDGSSIHGFARIDESDMIARPDPTTFAVLPWRPKESPVARMFCDIYEPD
jgi:glutamine synthetase